MLVLRMWYQIKWGIGTDTSAAYQILVSITCINNDSFSSKMIWAMTAFHYSTHIQPVPDSRPCAITNTYRSREFCKYSLTNAYNYLFTIIKRIDLREELTIIINLIISFNRAKQTTCVIRSDGFTKLPAVLSFFPGFLTEWICQTGWAFNGWFL